jgi:hypothetical protein
MLLPRLPVSVQMRGDAHRSVLLHFCFFARRDDFGVALWGRLISCGRLSIGPGQLRATASRRVGNPPQDPILPHVRRVCTGAVIQSPQVCGPHKGIVVLVN